MAVAVASETRPFHIQEWTGFYVLRDDRLPGGTKRRALEPLLRPGREYVFAGPQEGFAQLALAYAATAVGAEAVSFVAARDKRHENVDRTEAAGGRIVEVRPGHLTVVRARARAYCELTGAELFPLSFAFPGFEDALAESLAPLIGEVEPSQVWCAAGTGLLTRALQRVFPRAEHFAVQVGRELAPGAAGDAQLLVAPERFSQAARMPPPFPSARHYDAKVWQFFNPRAQAGALFWNVAA